MKAPILSRHGEGSGCPSSQQGSAVTTTQYGQPALAAERSSSPPVTKSWIDTSSVGHPHPTITLQAAALSPTCCSASKLVVQLVPGRPVI